MIQTCCPNCGCEVDDDCVTWPCSCPRYLTIVYNGNGNTSGTVPAVFKEELPLIYEPPIPNLKQADKPFALWSEDPNYILGTDDDGEGQYDPQWEFAFNEDSANMQLSLYAIYGERLE